MIEQNNYLKILLHLKQFEGDGKFYEIESLLSDLEVKEKRLIIVELAKENFITIIDGKTVGGILFSTGDGKGNVKHFHSGSEEKYIPYSGKITFKGSKYLKEEIEMKDNNKYQINIDGNSTANLIIESPGAVINNKSEIIAKTKTIIEKIENDNSIDKNKKQQVINGLTEFINEVEVSKPKQDTINKIMGYGADISSIGSLVISLIQLLASSQS